MTPSFPWYDSPWISSYIAAKSFIATHYSNKLNGFVDSFNVLRTNPDFTVTEVNHVFNDEVREKINDVVGKLQQAELEKHEIFSFGRLITHNQPFLTKLQMTLTDLVSDFVQEPVEPSYNFLSLYNNLGICKVHLDAPSAKWTLDYCIDQSDEWPIHFSNVRPWPEDWIMPEENWEEVVKTDPQNNFQSFTLRPNQAIIFSGSSQWHYRDRIQQKSTQNYCHLLFFHFIPKGTSHLVDPLKWADHFNIPELSELVHLKVR